MTPGSTVALPGAAIAVSLIILVRGVPWQAEREAAEGRDEPAR